MKSLGLSGAKLLDTIVKTGPGCLDQAILMGVLGDQVCPCVLGTVRDPAHGDGYVMEKLTPVSYLDDAERVLMAAHELLQTRVWNRPARNPRWDWQTPLRAWLGEQGRLSLARWLEDIYLPDHGPWTLTHGDPTLANALWGPDGRLRLGDPLWPAAGGKVPSLPDVDRGKLLQSAIGWERQLDDGYDNPYASGAVLRGLSEVERRRAWFWCAVHCLRLVPYAERAQRGDLAEWGRTQATLIELSRLSGLYRPGAHAVGH